MAGKMIGPSSRPHSDEWGITSIETAIVLIAVVVVASVFAFTMLSTGTVATRSDSEGRYGVNWVALGAIAELAGAVGSICIAAVAVYIGIRQWVDGKRISAGNNGSSRSRSSATTMRRSSSKSG